MSLLFISHASSDHIAAEEMCGRLKDHGFAAERSIFLDFDGTAGIQAGQRWEQTLYRSIRACRGVIVLCSRASMASRWCFMEMTHARALGKALFPVKVEDCDIDAVLSDHQVVDLTKDKELGYQRLWGGILAAGIDPTDVFEWRSDRSPYPGLLAFEQEDAAVFFGREREIADGLDLVNKVRRLADTTLIMVLGASGSGKSSLVRAGIVPRLRKDVERWIVTDTFRPKDDPARELAGVLSRAFRAYGSSVAPEFAYDRILDASIACRDGAAGQSASGANSDLEKPVRILGEFARSLPARSDLRDARRYLSMLRASLAQPDGMILDALADKPTSNPLVELLNDLGRQSGRDAATVILVIDQFEELLGQGEERQSAAFLRLLRTIVEHPGRPAVILATMRSDFLDQFQKDPAISGMRWESLSVGPMGTAEIQQVIEKPAAVAGIELESGLVQALVADTTTSDALPLLAFTLRELSDKYAQDRLLSVDEYRNKLGGLQGAVAKSADDLLNSARVTPAQEDLLRRGFLRMVRITDGGAYARVAARWEDFPSELHPILERFVTARLLVSDNREAVKTVEVAHEALFRSWDKLAQWLAASREALLLKANIDSAANEWKRKGEDSEYLWSGSRVARARELLASGDLPVNALGEEFVNASHHAAELRRKADLRRLQIVATVVSVLFIIAVASGLYARRKQAAAEVNAREANWQAWQAEGQKFGSSVSARIANWQAWQAEGQGFLARRGERIALEARAAEEIQRRTAEENARIAKTNEEEAERQRLRVQLGNLIAQLDQLGREEVAETDEEQRKEIESERSDLRVRAEKTVMELAQKLAAEAHFRGELKVITDFEVGKLLASGDNIHQLARLQSGMSVVLYPDTYLGYTSESDLRAGYEDLLTPAQFQSALKLLGKKGAGVNDLWKESKRLHNVTLSPYLGNIILDVQMIQSWNRLGKVLPAMARDDIPASVQTAGLFIYRWLGQPGIRTIEDATQRRDWRRLATDVEGIRMQHENAFTRKQLAEVANAIRTEVSGHNQ